MTQRTCGNLGQAGCQQAAADPSGLVIVWCIHNACSHWTPWLLFIWRLSINGKLQIAFEHLHAAHVSLDISSNESHMSPVWTLWKRRGPNEAASQLNVFTLHTPLWHGRWCERLQVSGGDEETVIVRGEGGPRSGRKGPGNGAHSSLGMSARGQRTWLIRYGPVHLRHQAAC